MKDYNHLSFQTNNMFPSTQATEQASLFVKTEKKTQSSARKIPFRYFADIPFFPKYVAAVTKATKTPKPNQTKQQNNNNKKSSGDNVYAKHLDNG